MSAPLSSERIAQIQARVDAATEGPWERSKAYRINVVAPKGFIVARVRESLGVHEEVIPGRGLTWIVGHYPVTDGIAESSNAANGDFIAHARSDIPALLAEVERLTAERDRVLALASKWATEDNDFDEDTEARIACGQQILETLLAPAPVVADPSICADSICAPDHTACSPVVADPDTEATFREYTADNMPPGFTGTACRYCGSIIVDTGDGTWNLRGAIAGPDALFCGATQISRHEPIPLPGYEHLSESAKAIIRHVMTVAQIGPAPVTVRAGDLTAEHCGRQFEKRQDDGQAIGGQIITAPETMSDGWTKFRSTWGTHIISPDTPVTLLPEGGDNR